MHVPPRSRSALSQGCGRQGCNENPFRICNSHLLFAINIYYLVINIYYFANYHLLSIFIIIACGGGGGRQGPRAPRQRRLCVCVRVCVCVCACVCACACACALVAAAGAPPPRGSRRIDRCVAGRRLVPPSIGLHQVAVAGRRLVSPASVDRRRPADGAASNRCADRHAYRRPARRSTRGDRPPPPLSSVAATTCGGGGHTPSHRDAVRGDLRALECA